ncbi:MAG: cysteine desulfurase NifS [Candidatus Margulisbacteria bacterium]|nr:cysteine desulfurase NifS [Candidatus Margulisiibacteriota bacterium]
MPKKNIYLDNNATTALHPEVVKKIQEVFPIYGNASSMHAFGREAKKELDLARDIVANALGASNEEIIFTASGTEADNLAIKGVAAAYRHKGNHIITSAIEHPAVLNTCNFLMKKGFEITFLPVDEYGVVNPKDLEKAITNQTILVTIMIANNEIGTIQPIKELAAIAKKKNILFHTDAVQAVGKIPVNVNELGVDLLSLSGHKFYAPKGVGVLYLRKGVKVEAQLHGGHQEHRLRSGTYNVLGIAAMGKALELAVEEMPKEMLRVKKLKEKLYKGIISNLDDIKLHGNLEKCLPNTLGVSFKYIEGEGILLRLDQEGIAVSTGSACSSGSLEPSHVLLALGLSHEVSHGSIRFSLGRDTTEEEIDYTIEKVVSVVNTLREMSPLYEKNRK